MKNNATTKVISTFLIILWIYAAGSKLLVFNNFAHQRARQPLPTWSVPILQWLIPTIELIVIALLSSSKTLAQGFKRSFFLLAPFTLYVGFGLAHIYHKPQCS